jgi:GNAT superfamily N-acetyltransferase
MVDLVLRKTTAVDSEFAYQTKKGAFRVYVEQVWGWDEDEQRAMHQRRFDTQDFQIINVCGSDIGILSVIRQSDCMKVNQIYIIPEQQGRGISTACTVHVMDDAAALKFPVRLQLVKINHRAISFYQRLGFISTGKSDIHVLMEKLP